MTDTHDANGMGQQFQDMAEMQAYCNSQYRVIVEQSRKIHTLEQEVVHLRKLLEGSTPLVKDPSKTIEIFTDCTDQEAICRIELKKLKDLSIERELSLEEAKRTEIYTKLLLSLKEKGKAEDVPIGRLDDTALLALLTDDSAGK